MDPSAVKSALELLDSTESNTSNTNTSNSKSSTSSTSNNNNSSLLISNHSIKQPNIPKRKASKASTPSSHVVSSNSTGNALLGASKFKLRGNNPLTSPATSTSAVIVSRDGGVTTVITSSNTPTREMGGVKQVQKTSAGGGGESQFGNEKMLPPSSVYRNSIGLLNNDSSGSSGLERKNSKGSDQPSADRFLRSSTSRPFLTSSHQASNLPQSISPPPQSNIHKSSSVGVNRSQTNSPHPHNPQISPPRPQISQILSYHTSATSSTLDAREIDELQEQEREEEERTSNDFEGREILPTLTRETSNGKRFSAEGGRINQTFVDDQEDGEDDDIVLVDRNVGSSGGDRSTSRRSHSRDVVQEEEEDFKPDDQDIPLMDYHQSDRDRYDRNSGAADSLRMTTNSRRDGIGSRGMKRIGGEDLDSHTGGTVEKYRMVYDHEGRSYRAPQNHHNHYESERDEHHTQDQQYLTRSSDRYPVVGANEYQIQRSQSPYAPPHRLQTRQAHHQHEVSESSRVPDIAISTTIVKFNPLSSLTTLYPGETNPHYHLANLRLNQEIEVENDNDEGIERDADGEVIKGSAKSHKWEDCSTEEWEKGGEVLKNKFGDLMSRMVEIVVRKATRTKEYEKRMEEHQTALKEREQAIAGTWSNVGSWAGELVGLKN